MRGSNKMEAMMGNVPLLAGDPLLTDIENPESTIECVLCNEYDPDTGKDPVLYWYEYHPSIHSANAGKICDHCLMPPPKNIDIVMCSRHKHVYCLYCIELKLFRVQLGRFVMEPDDKDKDDPDTHDLGMQWEKDYVHYHQLGNGNRGRGRSRSVADTISGKGMCGCFGKKDNYFTEDAEEDRARTTRLSGYNSAKNQGYNDQIIEMGLTDESQKKQKQKKKKKSKGGGDGEENDGENEEDSDEINKNDDGALEIVDEAEIDEMYQEDFGVNPSNDIILEHNKKKLKAVAILLEACQKGHRQPPSVIIELNYDKYAVYCFSYVMGKLELKQRNFLFHTLEFIAMVSPTTVMIQLIMQYKKQFLMLPYKRIDQVLLSVIRGSKYSIATSLKMASLAAEFAAIDLSSKDIFLKLKEKYEGIAVELIKQIESHHLAALLLETPSDIEGMTPLELAFEYKLFSFLSQSKIEKIAHQVWYEQFFLNPKRTFEVSDVDAWAVLELMKNPYRFYFSPFGKYVIQTFLYFSYLLMFSWILYQRPAIYDTPEPIEVIFWVFNIGYLGFECYQALIEDGLKDYLTDWTNYIDMSISINFAAQIILRVIFIFSATINSCDNYKLDRVEFNYNTGLAFHPWQKCPTQHQIMSASGYWPSGCDKTFADWPLVSNDSDYLIPFNASDAFYYSASAKCDRWKQLDFYLSNSCCRKSDDWESVLFNFLYGFNAILLWMRVLYFAEQNSTLGPLIKIIMAMKDDFINYLKLTLLFMVGFSFAIRAFIGDYSYEFSTASSTILYMFKSTFGKIDFSVLEACGEASDDLCKDNGWVSEWRSNLVQLLIMLYLIISLIMIRLLIAMISFTYNKMIRQAEYQVVYQYIKNAYELDRSSGLMPPPLNIFVFACTIVWLIMDFLMVILINRYIDVENHLQLAKPVGTSYIKRVWHGIQDLFARNTSYWICAYCREHNYEKYDINNYLTQFRPACDPADTKIVEVYHPTICQKCYRHKSAVGRITIVLQQISFIIFMILVYPVLVVIVFIPAAVNWFANFLSDTDSSEGQWADNGDDDEDEEEQSKLKRHQTMGNAYRANKLSAHDRKQQKIREKQEKQRKRMIKKAEKYRMLRQMQQLDTQLNALPTTEGHTAIATLKKSLKQIIKNYNPRKVKHILTPNINDIVDEVTSDKTPIAKLQAQVSNLQNMVTDLTNLMKASQKLNVATTLANIKSNQSMPNDDELKGDDYHNDEDDDDGAGNVGGGAVLGLSATSSLYKPSSLNAVNAHKKNKQKRMSLQNRDSMMGFVSAAAEQLQSALTGRASNVMTPADLNNANDANNQFEDIAASILLGKDDKNGKIEANKSSITMKPTDVMRHKSSYKRKSTNNVLGDVGMDSKTETTQQQQSVVVVPISSTLTAKDYDFNDDKLNEINLSPTDLNDDEEQQEEEVVDKKDKKKKKLPMVNAISDNTEKYLDGLLDEEVPTDTEKP